MTVGWTLMAFHPFCETARALSIETNADSFGVWGVCVLECRRLSCV
jgi:hypothetical protein